MSKLALALILTGLLLLRIGLAYAEERRQIICNPNSVVALHEEQRIYPAWKYECAEGYDIIILD